MKVETHSIDYIPPTERHGKVSNLFFIWFTANMQITTIVTGALGIVLGLNLTSAILAILIGNAAGAVFMAYHSAQGPKLGIPQMIQSRAQFGLYGAILPLLLVIVMYLGYFATSAVLGGQALAAWLGMPIDLAIILVSLINIVLAIVGYDLIHQYEKWAGYLFAIVFVLLTIRLWTIYPVHAPTAGHFTWSTFLLAISISTTWQITYAPYVADYSRYLPQDTSIRQCFGYTYWGSVIGTVWMMSIGAVMMSFAAKAFNANTVAFVADRVGGSLSAIVFPVIVLGIIGVNVLNLYGAFMSTTTTLHAIKPWRFGALSRISIILAAGIVGTALAIWGQGNFLNNYSNFLLLILYVLIPWTAINLTDFYWVRHGQYDIPSILHAGGQYPKFNRRSLFTFVLTTVIEIPFINTTLYEGPIAKAMGGADISWIVGLIVASTLYFVLMKRERIAIPSAMSKPL
ncbi:cytosine permease [Sulfobacillus sp. hq2]|uniref:purine-cytosine permease family protein n=1 Tax=Sulfobacillus TaxID=28033 RepID=UPI000CD169E9|nr:cytosine permease [Sulfobacillus sp. hq2]POB09434.1 cytosine permease [Sulfobacillus sp. hq2]